MKELQVPTACKVQELGWHSDTVLLLVPLTLPRPSDVCACVCVCTVSISPGQFFLSAKSCAYKSPLGAIFYSLRCQLEHNPSGHQELTFRNSFFVL